jgi:hypothetical protein
LDEDGLTCGATITTHFTRGEVMDTYVDLHRKDPRTKDIYVGEFMTIVEVSLW